MRRVLRRLGHLLVVLLTVTLVTFAMVDLLPGDAALILEGAQAAAEQVDALRTQMGLDENLLVRYTSWLTRALGGHMGHSLLSEEPVGEMLRAALPVTVELLLLAQTLALALAVPTAISCAMRPGSRWDRWVGAGSFALLSLPSFVTAILLVYLFAVWLRWLPATGFTPLSAGLFANVRSLVLPAVSIALVEWVPLARVLRSDLIATLEEDFILLARSKGLNRTQVLLGHALRPSALTLVTVVGLQMGHLIGGAVVVESIFALPGIGRLLLNAIYARDFFVVQGCVLWITVGYLTLHLLIELVYVGLDPRVRDGAVDG